MTPIFKQTDGSSSLFFFFARATEEKCERGESDLMRQCDHSVLSDLTNISGGFGAAASPHSDCLFVQFSKPKESITTGLRFTNSMLTNRCFQREICRQ